MTREYEDQVTIYVNDEEIVVDVKYIIMGAYRPATTWGYDGGCPAEYPELEVVWLCHADNTDKRLEFSQVFNDRPTYPLTTEKWEPVDGLLDYGQWESDMLEKKADPDGEW